MRFEAKNAYIKTLVGKNFKNLCYSIAERHQNYMCLQLLSPPDGSSINYLYRGDEIGNGNVCNNVQCCTCTNFCYFTVTFVPCGDATLITEAREVVVEKFPLKDSLPR